MYILYSVIIYLVAISGRCKCLHLFRKQVAGERKVTGHDVSIDQYNKRKIKVDTTN